MDSTTYAECSSCNCSPGFCAARERVSQVVTNAAIQNVLNGVGGYNVAPESSMTFVRKNRAQRRKDQYLAKRGPVKKRR